MVTLDIDKLTVTELRRARGWSMRQLAQRADISESSVSQLENTQRTYCISTGVALRVAAAFDMEVHEIKWHRSFSDIGRPVGTGSPIRSGASAVEMKKCPTHNIVLPATGICDDC